MNRKDFFKMMFGGIATAVFAPKLLAEVVAPQPDFFSSFILDKKAVNLAVYLNGRMLIQGADYTIDRSAITFVEPPPRNSVVTMEELIPLHGDGCHDDTAAIQQRLDRFGCFELETGKAYAHRSWNNGGTGVREHSFKSDVRWSRLSPDDKSEWTMWVEKEVSFEKTMRRLNDFHRARGTLL